jgi:hypothetical protein
LSATLLPSVWRHVPPKRPKDSTLHGTSVKSSNPMIMRFINVYGKDTFSFTETTISLQNKKIRDAHLLKIIPFTNIKWKYRHGSSFFI